MMDAVVETLERQWHVRPATKQDEPAIVDLLNTVFGNWGDRATWSWKYENPCAAFQLNSAVAEVDGRIVGHYGIIPLTIVHRGSFIRGAQAVDAAVSPDYRRQGMMSSLAKYVLDEASDAEVHFIYAFPGLYSLSVNERIGFQPVMFVPEMVRVLDWKGFLTERLRSLPKDIRAFWQWRYKGNWSPNVLARLTNVRSTLLWMLGWLSAPVRRHRVSIRDFDVHPLTTFDIPDDMFCPTDSTLRLVKNTGYLSWRYSQQPHQEYQNWGVYRSGSLIGYLVMKAAEFKSSICEIACLPGCENAVFPLVETAARSAKESGSYLLDIWATENSSIWPLLRKMGFISPYRLHRFAKSHAYLSAQLYQIILYTQHLTDGMQSQIVEDSRDWSLSMGDSDLV